jgi:predicted Ser/Thr protein kinase
VEKGVAVAKGTFGITYRAVWRGGEVAVKDIRTESAQEVVSFLREVEVRVPAALDMDTTKSTCSQAHTHTHTHT